MDGCVSVSVGNTVDSTGKASSSWYRWLRQRVGPDPAGCIVGLLPCTEQRRLGVGRPLCRERERCIEGFGDDGKMECHTCAYKQMIFNGHFHCVLWEDERHAGGILPSGAVIGALVHGDLECLRWARVQKKYTFRLSDWIRAAAAGQVHVVQWLRQGVRSVTPADEAVMEWLEYPLEDAWVHESFCNAAARHGQIDMLVWLRTEGLWAPDSVCDPAARYGQLDVLEWMRREHDEAWYTWIRSLDARGWQYVLSGAEYHQCSEDVRRRLAALCDQYQWWTTTTPPP